MNNTYPNNWGTPVRIVETGEVFPTVAECARALSCHPNYIYDCLTGEQKTCRKYHIESMGRRASEIHPRDNYREPARVILICYRGETHTFKEWAQIFNISVELLRGRYYKGWREDKLFQPKRAYLKSHKDDNEIC